MNYSASEDYHARMRQFDKKAIQASKVRRRWFRNHYVLQQTKHRFTTICFVMKGGAFNPVDFSGDYYGPFLLLSTAKEFAEALTSTHRNYLYG